MVSLEQIVASLVLPIDARDALKPRLAESISLWRAGEEGIALENLCDNLDDFGVAIDSPTCDELIRLCQRFHVSPKRIALLDTLRSPTARPH